MDQSDRDVQFLVQAPTKEIGHGGEAAPPAGGDVRRIADNPAGVNRLLRRRSYHLRYREEPYHWVVGARDLFFRVIDLRDPHLHVGLTRPKPDIADQYIFERRRLRALDRERVGATSLEGPEPRHPFS